MGASCASVARVGAYLGLLLAFSCGVDGVFVCESSAQCGQGGICEPNGYCSFVAGDCPSGRAWGEQAPRGVAGQCVPPPDEPSGGSTGTAGQVDDATTGTGGSTQATGGADDNAVLTASGTTADAADSAGTDTTGASTAGGDTDGTTGTAAQRVTDGLLVLYIFDAGSGDTVADVSGVAPAMPLTLQYEAGSPSWSDDGLDFAGGGVAVVEGSSTKVRTGLQATEAMTLEVWVTPSAVVQTGPPRLLTLSYDTSLRSFSLMHGGISPEMGSLPVGDQYGVRLQTGALAEPNGLPEFITDSVAQLLPTHVVATRDADASLSIWVDGALLATETREGSFDVWPTDHALAVGNEVGLGRPYAGTIHLAAIYDRALSPAEVVLNRDAGY